MNNRNDFYGYKKRDVNPVELKSLTGVVRSILQSERYEQAEDKSNCIAYNLLLRGFRHEDAVSKDFFDDMVNLFKGADK